MDWIRVRENFVSPLENAELFWMFVILLSIRPESDVHFLFFQRFANGKPVALLSCVDVRKTEKK